MRKIAFVAAAIIASVAIDAETPANAAVGQCFDASGRPVGPPHDTKNPPYGMICSVYRRGGHCSHVQPQWAESNCGVAPRFRYRDNDYRGYRYREDDRRYRRRYDD